MLIEGASILDAQESKIKEGIFKNSSLSLELNKRNDEIQRLERLIEQKDLEIGERDRSISRLENEIKLKTSEINALVQEQRESEYKLRDEQQKRENIDRLYSELKQVKGDPLNSAIRILKTYEENIKSLSLMVSQQTSEIQQVKTVIINDQKQRNEEVKEITSVLEKQTQSQIEYISQTLHATSADIMNKITKVGIDLIDDMEVDKNLIEVKKKLDYDLATIAKMREGGELANDPLYHKDLELQTLKEQLEYQQLRFHELKVLSNEKNRSSVSTDKVVNQIRSRSASCSSEVCTARDGSAIGSVQDHAKSNAVTATRAEEFVDLAVCDMPLRHKLSGSQSTVGAEYSYEDNLTFCRLDSSDTYSLYNREGTPSPLSLPHHTPSGSSNSSSSTTENPPPSPSTSQLFLALSRSLRQLLDSAASKTACNSDSIIQVIQVGGLSQRPLPPPI